MSQPSQPIPFFNRYTQQVEQEIIYGEGPLRFAYENPVGRMALELFVKRRLFSRWYGWRMDRPASRSRVLPFIEKYGLDAQEFADPPESFATFNEFFFRKLKPASRPIDAAATSVVFPADGRHLGFQDVSQTYGIFVKGQKFDLPDLLGNAALAERYQRGTLVLSRLCPVDYHRFHFPAAVLLKGGHLRGTEAVDWLHHAEGTQAYRAPFIPNVSTHGTGCTYAAAITSRLALGDSLPVAVAAAKHYVSHAIRTSFRWNEVQALNHFLVP